MTRAVVRYAVGLAAALVLGACTGTFTPSAPTLYLVFLDADAASSAPARVALLAFEATPTERRLDLLTPVAYDFEPGEELVAVDMLDREGRSEAWVLTSVGGGREMRLHRLDLRSVPDVPGATLPLAAPVRTLTDAAGAWIGFEDAGGLPTGCLADLVVRSDGEALALFDAGTTDSRCSPLTDDTFDPSVHVVDLVEETVVATIEDTRPPGVRPGEPGEPGALLLVRRPVVGALDAREILAVTFDDPVPDLGERGTTVEGLLDVAGVPGGVALLRSADGDRQLAVTIGDTTTEVGRAPSGATNLHVDPTGRLDNLLTTGGGRLGVLYPGESVLREISFDADALTVEPLNAYALAVGTSSGLCLVDLLVPSTASSCDLALDPALRAALPAPRFVTWTYAEPAAP